MTTLLQLRNGVRFRIVEPVARYFTDSELNGYINMAYHDFVAYAQPCKKMLAYTVGLKKATFDIPTDCMFGIERINWSEQFPLLHVTESEFRQRMWTAPTASTTRPFMYQQNPPGGTGAQFQIWPGPSEASATCTLATSIDADDTTIHASAITVGAGGSAGSFPTQGFFWLEDEQIRYWDIDTSGNNFLYCERGSGYTTAVAHFTGGFYSPSPTITTAPLQVLYRFDPPDLANNSDTVLFTQTAWTEALIAYASALCFFKRKELNDGNKQMEMYARIRDEAKLVRERENLDRPTVFMGDDPAEYMNWY